MKRVYRLSMAFAGLFLIACSSGVAQIANTRLVPVANGWAQNSVNTVVFRKSSLTSYKDIQFIAFYDADKRVILGKRKLGEAHWELKTTPYKGNTNDAHNSISIMIDGAGYLHLSWDHHSNPLHYCKSVQPFSLELTGLLSMTGKQETQVTYPEFYRMPDGNLLFFYRDGRSGEGNLVVNSYTTKTGIWQQLHSNLVDGEHQRNAYWQACTDEKGTIHLSWVWRESSDVASNHDLCYARSKDGGITWERSTGEKYQLPINAATAEYICRIPQKSELINQTAMYADESGTPFIASYWREQNETVPQYHTVYKINGQWHTQHSGFLTTAFSLSGAGTKRIPISRPQFVTWKQGDHIHAVLIFRSEERSNKISAAISNDIRKNKWELKDLIPGSVGSWEPSYDTDLWKQKKQIHLFVQLTDQEDAEGRADLAAQPVQVLEWDPKKK